MLPLLSTARFDEASLRVGNPVGPIELDVTYVRCVLCVSATRDFNPLHYDRDAAREAGMPDVFINTMTYQGLFGRLALDWAGTSGFLERLVFRMLQTNIPGDRMVISGKVGEILGDAGSRTVRLDLEISNQRVGVTTTGQAFLRWASD